MLKVFWRSQEMESFTLKCRNEEQLKLWQTTLERYLEKLKDRKKKKQSIAPNKLQLKFDNDDEEFSPNKTRPPRPPPPEVELRENPPNAKSFFDNTEDKAEYEQARSMDSTLGRRRSSLSYAAQMPSPIPSYKPPPPYDYPHIFSNEGLSKEEKKPNIGKAPPRPSPPPQIKLDDVVQPLGSDRPKSVAAQSPKRPNSSAVDEGSTYNSPRKAPLPPSDKFRIRSGTVESTSLGREQVKTPLQPIKVKIHVQNDHYAFMITEKSLTYAEFYSRIQTKIKAAARFKVKYYKDEDRSTVFILNDNDVLTSLQYSEKREDKTLNIFIVMDI
eukprot:NODE_445_length_7306_cov_0.516997.p3 type:complete len:328 gc:universal NODE_445_length_7306_cov_0.516997:5494-4511(-)